MRSVTPEIEAGNVHLPDPGQCPWIGDYLKEFADFPRGSDDDQVDATVHALMRFNAKQEQMPTGKLNIVSITKQSLWK